MAEKPVNVSKCSTGVVKFCGRNIIFVVAGVVLAVLGMILALFSTTITGTWPSVVVTVSDLGWIYWIMFMVGIILVFAGMFHSLKKK